jgi:hypothetical protein
MGVLKLRRGVNVIKESAPTPSWLVYALLTISGPLGFGGVSCRAATDQPATPTYRFELTQGEGTPICNAFLDRLKRTRFSKPPYCGIPEEDAAPGFETLHQVALTKDEVVALFTHVHGFTWVQNEDNVAGEDPPKYRAFYEGGDTLAWRYEPEVSVNNDGQPDNLLIWQGVGLYEGGIRGEDCGGRLDELEPIDHPIGSIRAGRQAFVLTANNQSIDQERTIQLFAHPGSLPAPNRFAPIGIEISFLKYRGLYYQEVFYSDQSGDLKGARKSDPKINSTLAILLRRRGKAKQICEYRFVSQVSTRSTLP